MLTAVLSAFLMARVAPPDTISAMPPDLFLVRAAVVSAEQEEGQVTILHTLRVEHVYGGAADIRGRTFSAYSATEPTPINPYATVPRLEVGEESIWLLSESNQALHAQSWHNYMRWPVRVVHKWQDGPNYQTISEFAERVEATSRQGGDQSLIDALRALAVDKNPYVSSWALSRLLVPATKDELIAQFLDQLTLDDRVPVQGQVELDKVLVKVRGARWRESLKRYQLFTSWLEKPRADRDAYLIVNRLDEVSQHPDTWGFAQDELLGLTAILVENERFALAERKHAGGVLGWAAKRYDDDQPVFDMVCHLVDSPLPEELRREIAWAFLSFRNLDGARRAKIERLRETVKAKSVRDVLDGSISRTRKTKKGRVGGGLGNRARSRRKPHAQPADNCVGKLRGRRGWVVGVAARGDCG